MSLEENLRRLSELRREVHRLAGTVQRQKQAVQIEKSHKRGRPRKYDFGPVSDAEYIILAKKKSSEERSHSDDDKSQPVPPLQVPFIPRNQPVKSNPVQPVKDESQPMERKSPKIAIIPIPIQTK